MKTYKTLVGSDKLSKMVKYNGAIGLAQELKPTGTLDGIVMSEDDETGKVTYYLVIKDASGVSYTYATGVKREVERLEEVVGDFEGEALTISCTTMVSRKTGQKFFKILIMND